MATTWTGLTTDEANGVMIAVSGSWADMWVHLRDDGNAPLFYAIVRTYAQFFGYHGATLKFLMIGLSTASVPLSYWIFRRLLAKELCLALAWMLALCPTFVFNGVLIRPYAIAGVLGMISTLACLGVLSPKTNARRVIAYGVSTALVVYTHYWGAFVPIGHVGLVLVGLLRKWFGWRQVGYWFAGAVLSLILFLPQALSVCMVLFGVTCNLTPFDAPPRPVYLTCDFIPDLLLSAGNSPRFVVQLMMLTCDFLVFLAFVSPKVLMVAKPDSGDPPEIIFDGRMWKAATICGLAAAFFVDLFAPSLRFRYLMPFVPMIFVVCITGMNELFAKYSKAMRVALPCAIWITIFIPYLLALTSLPETTADAVVHKIAESADRKKDVVLIAWEVISPAINFDLPDDIESISYPHIERTNINRWTDMQIKLRQDMVLPQLFTKLQAVLDRGGKVWFIDARHPIRPLDYRVRDLVKDDPFKIATLVRTDQIRSWLLGHSTQMGETQLAPGRDFSIILSVFSPVGSDAPLFYAIVRTYAQFFGYHGATLKFLTVDPEENVSE